MDSGSKPRDGQETLGTSARPEPAAVGEGFPTVIVTPATSANESTEIVPPDETDTVSTLVVPPDNTDDVATEIVPPDKADDVSTPELPPSEPEEVPIGIAGEDSGEMPTRIVAPDTANVPTRIVPPDVPPDTANLPTRIVPPDVEDAPGTAAGDTASEPTTRIAPPEPPAPSAPDLLLLEPGERFAGFVIEAELGRGEMGIVYRTRNQALNRVEALKVIGPKYASDPEYAARFMREASHAALTANRHIVTVYTASEHNGRLYMAMQYVAGGNLRERILNDGPLAGRDAAEITRQVSSALDAAHDAGLVHRDVKPANILLDSEGGAIHAYLTDFGVSRRADGADDLTRPGSFVGAPYYAAPEQHRGEKVDRRTDVYSLGCVLFEMLTGRVPFVGATSTAVAIAHCSYPTPVPSEVRAGVPAGFDQVVAKAMAKAPADRYQTAGELGAAAAAAAEGLLEIPAPEAQEPDPPAPETQVTTAVPVDPSTRDTEQVPLIERRPRAEHVVHQPPQPPPPQDPWFRRPGAVAGLGALIVAIIVAGLFAGGVIGGSSTHSSTHSSTTSTSFVTVTSKHSSSTNGSNGNSTQNGTNPNGSITPTSPSTEGALAAVQNYWNDINAHHFSAAYNILAPGAVSQSEAEWAAGHQDVTSAQFTGTVVSGTTGGNASVQITRLQTVSQQTGCVDWSGTYPLSYSGGHWLIQGAPIQKQPCS